MKNQPKYTRTQLSEAWRTIGKSTRSTQNFRRKLWIKFHFRSLKARIRLSLKAQKGCENK